MVIGWNPRISPAARCRPAIELSYVAPPAWDQKRPTLSDRTFRWWGLDGNKVMASFTSRRKHLAPPPEGSTVIGWQVGYTDLHHMIDMWADTDIQIDWLAPNGTAHPAH